MKWMLDRIGNSYDYALFYDDGYFATVSFTVKEYDYEKISRIITDNVKNGVETHIQNLVNDSVYSNGSYKIQSEEFEVFPYYNSPSHKEVSKNLNISYEDYSDLLDELELELTFLNYDDYEYFCDNLSRVAEIN